MDNPQHCPDHTRLSLLMQEIALKIVQEISRPVPQPTFHLHEGLMVVAGHWLPSLLLAMGQTHPAPPSLHPVPPRRSCTSYHTNQHQMNCTSYQNIFVPPKASPLRTGAGIHPCAPVPEASALDVPPPAVTMK